jgi:hypothetical protein
MDCGIEGRSLDDAYAHVSIVFVPLCPVSCPSCPYLALLPDLSAFLPNEGDLITKLGTRLALAA